MSERRVRVSEYLEELKEIEKVAEIILDILRKRIESIIPFPKELKEEYEEAYKTLDEWLDKELHRVMASEEIEYGKILKLRDNHKDLLLLIEGFQKEDEELRFLEITPEEYTDERKKEQYDEYGKMMTDKKIEKWEKYVYPIPKKKKKSHYGLFAPKGWLFQDREDDFVSIIRVAEKDWSIHWDVDREIHQRYDVEDAYAVLEGFESGDKKGFIDIWFVNTNQPITPYTPIKHIEEGIRELICIGEAVNSGEITNKKMNELRIKWGVGELERGNIRRQRSYRDIPPDPIDEFCEEAKTYETIKQCEELKEKRRKRLENYPEPEEDCYDVYSNKYGKMIKRCRPLLIRPLLIINNISTSFVKSKRMIIKSGRIFSRKFIISW